MQTKKKEYSEAAQKEKEQKLLREWRLLKKYQISTVIDIGANEGQFAAIARKFYPDALIYCFEPLPDVFSQLCENTESDPKITAINLGLSNQKGHASMFQSAFSPSSSLLSMANLHREEFPESDKTCTVPVNITSLDDWVLERNIKLSNDILIKIDVQGHEKSVIQGAIQTVKNSRIVILEVSFQELYEGQPLFDIIYTTLSELGFTYSGSLNQYFSQDRNSFLFADAVFENSIYR